MNFDPLNDPHRRFDPLSGRSVLVSPHRNLRPWRGRQEAPDLAARPSRDPACHLCPGSARAGGAINPLYTDVFVFDNDFPALRADTPDPPASVSPFRLEPARGACRVVCFSPDHARTLAEFDEAPFVKVIDAWVGQSAELGRLYPSVQIFENKGELMGCSNPHPHGQIWATSFLPHEVDEEDCRQRAHFDRTGAALLDEVAAREAGSDRVVYANGEWLVVVPFWAAWPFETLILPRFDARRMTDLEPGARASLADALRRLGVAYDNLFECSFPYSMGWHGAPFGAGAAPHWRLHAHFYPPLLRSATVRKFMVGFEMLAEAQRDLTPEQAAERLRATSATHYRARSVS